MQAVWIAIVPLFVGGLFGGLFELLTRSLIGPVAGPWVPPEVIVGGAFGLAVAVSARAGGRAPLAARSLIRPGLWFLGLVLGLAIVAGIAGYFLTRGHIVKITTDAIPVELHPRAVGLGFARAAIQLGTFIAGGVQVAVVWASRRTASR